MKISIITVVWNNQKTIKDAIESVLSQTCPDIEYVIVDGGSTDGTVDIIKSYGARITKFISEKDKGIYDAMNKGIRLATGDVVGILNSDDVYFDKDVITNVMTLFAESGAEAVYGDLCYVSAEDTSKVVRYWKSSPYISGSFRKGWHPAHPSFFVKREVYEKFGVFDVSMQVSADFEIMLRFIEKNKIKVAYLPEVLVNMRLGGESNKSFRNFFLGNRNIYRAFDKNGIKMNKILYPFYRFLPKILQFVKKGH